MVMVLFVLLYDVSYIVPIVKNVLDCHLSANVRKWAAISVLSIPRVSARTLQKGVYYICNQPSHFIGFLNDTDIV